MKPAERDQLRADVACAASIIASIDDLAHDVLIGNDDTGAMVAAISVLASEAHDLLDLAVRALGDPGLGYRGRVAQRLDGERANGAKHEATA